MQSREKNEGKEEDKYICIYIYNIYRDMINIYSKIDVNIIKVFKVQINLSYVVRKNTVIS